ncbi:carboxymuconolactone decarboxylase family protein [Sphingomonas quercus]|uniref:Carboxymuconolactone decarboxylase family protein n=1 Tax=Sphingomonas quercus TaxID=2842451 RepID=A0ABS6BIC8_9SPHN|nr:carboxymuconolactone decarboxylase family protein [Sphingomonas quercus]MBU3078063.1 carboxymuconolactone decarboxylase family protein [Sphingomonas quercus]
MTKDYKAITADIAAYSGQLAKLAPEAMQGFHALARGAGEGGAVDARTKEMIALAIGVTQRCDGCIGFHVKALVKMGTTREEVAEIMAMCVYMGGGPALMYAADALRAFDQFAPPA